MNAQFHVLKQEIVQMNGTLAEIKDQHFQQQIQQNKEEIDHVITRVSKVEASIQFNDSERAAIKDQIKHIEQRQKADAIRIQQAMKLAKQEPIPANITSAKALRNEAKIAFKSIQEEYIKAKLDEFKDDPKKFWSELNNVIPENKCKSNEVFNLLDKNSKALSNDVASTYVNDYFSTIGSTLAAGIGTINQHEQAILDRNQEEHFLDINQLKIELFTLNEIVLEINNINIYKSSGINNISSRILKDIWQLFPELLLSIVNKAILNGTFHKAWKHGTVIPIPKIPNPRQVGDLRPITLLPLPVKIMERLIHNKLYPYLEENDILTPKQNGFRKQHGTCFSHNR